MSYESALEAAGAKVLAFEYFGSYQGDWFAKVEYNGEVGWIQGSYGSCSYCDAFEGDFGYGGDDNDPDYMEHLAAFGRTYLDGVLPSDKQIELLENRGSGYYDDDGDILRFVKANA